MKKTFHVVEKENRFFIFKGEEEYRTVILNTVSSSDKGLAEAIARKLNEGKPNLVKLYLRKFDRQGLIDIILDLSINDKCGVNCTYLELIDFLNILKDIHLRKIVDAYSECGDIRLVNLTGTIDEDDYDWFGAGMAASSGISMGPVEDWAEMVIDGLCEQYADRNCSDNYTDEEYYKLQNELASMIPEKDLVNLMWKYCGFLLPKGPIAKGRFFDLIH